jgi:hypothetical protein
MGFFSKEMVCSWAYLLAIFAPDRQHIQGKRECLVLLG